MPSAERIEVHVAELKQLFNSIDPSPFREKDLDPNAAEFIVNWARDAHRDAPLELLVHVDRETAIHEAVGAVQEAVQVFFRERARSTRARLRQLFRVGRTSLVIGVICLVASMFIGSWLEETLGDARLGPILRESLLIGGWVAMWRPLETFLYDWWPIRAEARLYDRLGSMAVTIKTATP